MNLHPDRSFAVAFHRISSPPLVTSPQEVDVSAKAAVLEVAAVPSYIVDVLTGRAAQEAAQLVPGNGSGTDVHNPFLARVMAARELHGPQSERSCLHVELDVSGSQVGTPHLRLCSSD